MIVAEASQEFPQIYPEPGWVEHNPLDIWNTQITVAKKVLDSPGCIARRHRGDRHHQPAGNHDRLGPASTGHPVMNAIVWQDRRTAGFCDGLKARGLADYVRATTGLVIDAYFSGTKINWILDNVPGARERAEPGELCSAPSTAG